MVRPKVNDLKASAFALSKILTTFHIKLSSQQCLEVLSRLTYNVSYDVLAARQLRENAQSTSGLSSAKALHGDEDQGVPTRFAADEIFVVAQSFNAFDHGAPDPQPTGTARAQDQNSGLDALVRLFDIAHGNSGQCRRIAAFLLGLYNGRRFPFDLTDLRSLDEPIFEDCLRVLRMDSRPKAEVHTYFRNGGRAFENLANDWNLHRVEWYPCDQGFAAVIDGYDCMVKPQIAPDRPGVFLWLWTIQAGAGRGWRRSNVEIPVPLASGREYSLDWARRSIDKWFEMGGETPLDGE